MSDSANGPGGWFEYGPPVDPDEAQARHADIERLLAEKDRRLRDAARAEFGEQRHPVVSSLVLPISRVTVHWRSDGFVQVDGPDGTPADGTEWQIVDLDEGGITRVSEVLPGDSADATWWVAYGVARPADEVAFWLADDTDVPVVRLGYIWIAEWTSVTQAAFAQLGGRVQRLFAHRPAFLPPAEHPFARSAPNPRGQQP